MISWIVQNFATLLISSILIVIVTAVILKLVRDKRSGRSSCGGNCAACSHGCHK